MNTIDATIAHWEMRFASALLLVGGTAGFVANIFHPHDFPSETEPLLRMVAGMPHWSHLHFVIMISVVLLVSGLATLTRNLANPMAHALGTLGRYLIILGGAVYMIEVMVDGFAMRYF